MSASSRDLYLTAALAAAFGLIGYLYVTPTTTTSPEDYVALNNMLSSFGRMVDESINKPDNGLTAEQLKEYLTDDAVWSFEGPYPATSEGLTAIATDFNGFHSQFKQGKHQYTNRIIDTQAKKMYWYSYATWIQKSDGSIYGSRPAEGDYEADIVKEGGKWKIRKVVTRFLKD